MAYAGHIILITVQARGSARQFILTPESYPRCKGCPARAVIAKPIRRSKIPMIAWVATPAASGQPYGDRDGGQIHAPS